MLGELLYLSLSRDVLQQDRSLTRGHGIGHYGVALLSINLKYCWGALISLVCAKALMSKIIESRPLPKADTLKEGAPHKISDRGVKRIIRRVVQEPRTTCGEFQKEQVLSQRKQAVLGGFLQPQVRRAHLKSLSYSCP